ncbi:cytochrome c biogenesis heme-transporting ATPase CcmA [Variovorax rhizosphaerae]|uniref:Cytochrome c biogenesis heme-transporting ATPase CcmA n=1 Tax=Variovorax rhizosphaerae TaxID=1836200 RepID=A0ABU8WVV2_9BURK
MATPALELRDLGCVRSGRALFSHLNLSVPAGRLLRVTGANGAGKTSLLRMVCGLLSPACGEVLWRGGRIATLREEFHRQLVYLGHAAALKDDLSATENLLTAARLAGGSPSEQEAAAALNAAGLRGHERSPVRTLSQGQRRRVALARLVLGSAVPLWVLDEPFNALDATAAAWLVGLVSAHVASGGVVLLTSHQADLALQPTTPQQELVL